MQFDVYWNEIPGALTYIVTATPINRGARVSIVSQGRNIPQTVGNLQPGQLYSITVRGVYNTGMGEESEAIQQSTGKQGRCDYLRF